MGWVILLGTAVLALLMRGSMPMEWPYWAALLVMIGLGVFASIETWLEKGGKKDD